MKYTENYKLLKPDENDFFDVLNDNKNMDMLDAALKELKNDGTNHAADQTNPHNVTAAQVGASNPNLLINGDFQVWQRGTSFEQSAKPWVYAADRWRIGGINDGRTRTISKSNDGSLQVANKSREDIGYVYISQPLEISEEWKNKSYTVSAKLKAEATVRFFMQVKINGEDKMASFVLTDTYDTYFLHFQTPDNLTSLEVMIYAIPPATKINIKYIKLELGNVATHFVPRSYNEELVACQRYFERIGTARSMKLTDFTLVPAGATKIRLDLHYTSKRILPTIILSNLKHYRLFLSYADGGQMAIALTDNQISDVSIADTMGKDASITIVLSTARPVSSYVCLQRTDDATEAWIDVDAEIY